MTSSRTLFEEKGTWTMLEESMLRQSQKSYNVARASSPGLYGLFHLAKVKYPSCGMAQEEFDKLNIGPFFSEVERQELGNMLKHHEVFAFNPNE